MAALCWASVSRASLEGKRPCFLGHWSPLAQKAPFGRGSGYGGHREGNHWGEALGPSVQWVVGLLDAGLLT